MSLAAPMPDLLIIDDDRLGADVLARKLALRRFRVEIVDDGELALAHIEKHMPDLILLDALMPGLDGHQTLGAIRAKYDLSDLPIIMLTGLDDRTQQKRALSAGANDYVAKPADIEVLVARITTQLLQRHSHRKLQRDHARLKQRLETRERLNTANSDLSVRGELLAALRADLAADTLELVYQPKYDLRTGNIIGLEALLRWPNPYFAAFTPDYFVAVAEEGGAISSLTHWTIRRALADQAKLSAGGYRLPVSINLSPSLVSDRRAADELLDHLGSQTSDLAFELTEYAILHDPQEALASLHAFANAGVRLSIDDYGTGWSSLSYLQRLPIQELKIDRSFVTQLTRSHRDPLLVRSTIELAHALDLEVVAEGVEDAETMALLRVMGCDIVQGFHIAAPMPPQELGCFLGDRAGLTALAAPLSPMALFAAALTD